MLTTAERWIPAKLPIGFWGDLVIVCNLICVTFGNAYEGPRWVHRLLYCFSSTQSLIMLLIIESLLWDRKRGDRTEMAKRGEVRVSEAERWAHELEIKRIEAELVENRWELLE